MLSKNKDEMEKLLEEKGDSIIPKGDYCYSNMRHTGFDDRGLPTFKVDKCPYWDFDDEAPEQSNGYCWFLKEGDWDINETSEIINMKTGEVSTGNEIGLSVGLLWDECKECGINPYDEDEF